MSDQIVQLTSLEQFNSLIASPQPTIVKVFADFGGQSKEVELAVNWYAEQNPGVQFLSIDVNEHADIAEGLSVTKVPTFLLYQSGEKKDQLIGAHRPQLNAFVEQATKLIQ